MSSFNVVRSENGQIKFTLNNVSAYDINGVGKVTGSATFSVGNTGQKTNETVIQVGQTKDQSSLLMNVDDDIDNIQFYGENIEARFKSKTDKQYNVQWDASNSTLDSTKGAGSLMVNTGKNSHDNTFKLGDALTDQNLGNGIKADNIIVDNGKNNMFISASNSGNYFETSESSQCSTIFGGDKNNLFLVNGDKGSIIGGKADDTYITGEKSSENFLVGMDGDDSFTDFGDSNFVAGGKGKDSLVVNGKNMLGNLGNGDDYNVKISRGAKDNAVFAGEKMSTKDDKGNITKYNYTEYLNEYLDKAGISLEEFKAKVGLNEDASVYDIIDALKGKV